MGIKISIRVASSPGAGLGFDSYPVQFPMLTLYWCFILEAFLECYFDLVTKYAIYQILIHLNFYAFLTSIGGWHTILIPMYGLDKDGR